MAVSLEEDIPKLKQVIEVLDAYDAVTQQKLIELLAARHALRMTDKAGFVAASMYKHIRQLIDEA
jgi:hypothetical protein